ncbi:MAG: hypothetical protein QM662_16525 [Gordonia sp. (in: high G+C Gram-positive bacteria)]
MYHRHSTIPRPTVPLVVLTDDRAVRDYAQSLFDARIPVAIVSSTYSDIVPFMLANNGFTVALVADVDNPDQLAGAILTAEQRLGPVGAVIRYATDLPTRAPAHAAVPAA